MQRDHHYVCPEDAISEVIYPALGDKAPWVDVDALFAAAFAPAATGEGFEQALEGEAFWAAVEKVTY